MKLARNQIPVKAAASEQQVQRAVVAHLKVRAAPGTFMFAVPNGGYRRLAEAKILVGLGVRRGVPDLVGVREGRMYALELKTETGKLSDSQREVLDLMERAGATVAVAHGLDAALRWLEGHGLLKGRST